jgi:hypothetical protein
MESDFVAVMGLEIGKRIEPARISLSLFRAAMNSKA